VNSREQRNVPNLDSLFAFQNQEGKKDDIIKVHKEYKDKFDDTSKIIHSKLNLKFSNYSEYDLRRLKDEIYNLVLVPQVLEPSYV